MNLKTLRPGLLVSLKTGINGNISWMRTPLEQDHLTAEGTKRARWETKREITDPEEFENGCAVRSKCRGMIYKVCAPSTFGLLCPEDKRDELDEAVSSAQKMAAEFNATAALTRVHIYVIAGRIAADDVQAVRAINSEVRGLLTDMETGLKNLDVKVVREAANKAKSIGRMLQPEAMKRIQTAVDVAREMARKIVKAGEEGAVVIDRTVLRQIRASRTDFLDIEEEVVEVQQPASPARAVDLAPEGAAEQAAQDSPQPSRRRAAQPQLEV